MDHRIASARPLGRALTTTMAVAGAVALALSATPSLAQTKKPAAQAQPAQQAAPQQQAAPPQAQMPTLMYSPWTKVCQKGPETNNKEVCLVHKDGRLETGQPLVIAQVIEPEGADKRLQVILPIAVLVQNGTRILIDDQELAKAPYVVCAPQGGCSAFYKADDAVVSKLKKGKQMIVQAFSPSNQIVSLPLPLADFAKAYDGPPIDPKALEAQQRKLQSELQKKAEEARKRLEGGAAPAQPAPAQKK